MKSFSIVKWIGYLSIFQKVLSQQTNDECIKSPLRAVGRRRFRRGSTPLQTAPIQKLFRHKLQRLISRILATCNQTGIFHINVVMIFLRFQPPPPTISTPLGLKSPKTNQFLLQSVERCGLQRTHKIAIHTHHPHTYIYGKYIYIYKLLN